MNTIEKEIIIEKLNFVINSKTSSLSNTDIEFLVTIREQISRIKSTQGIVNILAKILQTYLLSP